MTKCHFCGLSAPSGQYITNLGPERLPACNKCLHDWLYDPDLIYTRLAKMCQGLGKASI